MVLLTIFSTFYYTIVPVTMKYYIWVTQVVRSTKEISCVLKRITHIHLFFHGCFLSLRICFVFLDICLLLTFNASLILMSEKFNRRTDEIKISFGSNKTKNMIPRAYKLCVKSPIFLAFTRIGDCGGSLFSIAKSKPNVVYP